MAFDERTLNGMSVLAAVANSGSFAAAAEALNMSQPGVSRAIARLEGRLDARLFDRHPRSVTLTDEGRRLYEQVVPLLTALEEAAESAACSKETVRGRLRVNVHPFFSNLILGPRLSEFLKAHPELKLDLVTRDQLSDTVSEGFDLAIRFGEPKSSSSIARKLVETRILTVASPSYLKEHGRPRSPDELRGSSRICLRYRNPETGLPLKWEFHRNGTQMELYPEGQLMVNDAGTMHAVSLAGYCIAQVMEPGIKGLIASGRLVNLFPDWCDERWPLYVLYPSRNHMPAKTNAFLDFISSIVGNPR
jgi:DNA-binding transcriptional LysR family regulator